MSALSASPSLQGTTVSRAAYAPHQAAKPAREDLLLKYVKYGRSQALPTDNVSTYATMNQLAFGKSCRRAFEHLHAWAELVICTALP